MRLFGALGCGVFLQDRNGEPTFGHGGADDGFQANAVASLGGFGVIVMANSDRGFEVFPAIEQEVTAQISEDIGDAAADDGDDGPLQGGDPGDDATDDDDGADDNGDDDAPDIDNPLDDDGDDQ